MRRRLIIAMVAALFGAVAASGAAASLFLIWSMWLAGPSGIPFALFAFVIAMFCTVPLAVVLGVPLYLILSLFWHVNWWNAAACGFVIGAASSGIYPYLLGVTPPTAVEGYVWAWDQEGMIALLGGFLGAVGGFGFHRSLRDLQPGDDTAL